MNHEINYILLTMQLNCHHESVHFSYMYFVYIHSSNIYFSNFNSIFLFNFIPTANMNRGFNAFSVLV